MGAPVRPLAWLTSVPSMENIRVGIRMQNPWFPVQPCHGLWRFPLRWRPCQLWLVFWSSRIKFQAGLSLDLTRFLLPYFEVQEWVFMFMFKFRTDLNAFETELPSPCFSGFWDRVSCTIQGWPWISNSAASNPVFWDYRPVPPYVA